MTKVEFGFPIEFTDPEMGEISRFFMKTLEIVLISESTEVVS